MNTKRHCEPCGNMENWFLRIDNLEQISVTQTADINSLLYDVSVIQAFITGDFKLSILGIDANKDWNGKSITNLNNISAITANIGGKDVTSEIRRIDFRIDAIDLFISGEFNITTLAIDDDKDWNGKSISNIGTVNGIDVSAHIHDGTTTGGNKVSFSNIIIDSDKDMNNKNLINIGTVDGRDISSDLNQPVKTTDKPTFDGIILTKLPTKPYTIISSTIQSPVAGYAYTQSTSYALIQSFRVFSDIQKFRVLCDAKSNSSAATGTIEIRKTDYLTGVESIIGSAWNTVGHVNYTQHAWDCSVGLKPGDIVSFYMKVSNAAYASEIQNMFIGFSIITGTTPIAQA